ncbi:hypothetical protein ACFQE5_01775 [Pseudonocardia hispaniensis]|uniref:Uncharacterized protein n=1 Tax=Pseudonocardia hispaniensis TaxID=904933 RepID=A0ABW1IWT0_9PSEU
MAFKRSDSSKLPLVFSTAAGALELKVDRVEHTISDRRSVTIPIAGAEAAVTRGEDIDKRFTGTRVAAGAAAGLVFLPLAAFALVRKKEGHVYLTITGADGESAIVKPLRVKQEARARQFAAEFNTWSARLGGSAAV